MNLPPQKITLEITNSDNIGRLDADQLKKIQEIFLVLVTSGGLTGVRGGRTILHFDGEGVFMGVELDYWPWRKRVIAKF